MTQIVIGILLVIAFLVGYSMSRSIKNAEIENKNREIKDLKFWNDFWEKKWQETQIPQDIVDKANAYMEELYEKYKQDRADNNAEQSTEEPMDYTQHVGFWKRLQMFVSNVNVGDIMSEEEKEMILNICALKQKTNNE